MFLKIAETLAYFSVRDRNKKRNIILSLVIGKNVFMLNKEPI